jgi:hypothetical protein
LRRNALTIREEYILKESEIRVLGREGGCNRRPEKFA